jgi:hypothetical protein
MMAAESEFQERFWSKVEVLPSKVKVVGQADTECWEWRGGRTGKGHGSVFLPERGSRQSSPPKHLLRGREV